MQHVLQALIGFTTETQQFVVIAQRGTSVQLLIQLTALSLALLELTLLKLGEQQLVSPAQLAHTVLLQSMQLSLAQLEHIKTKLIRLTAMNALQALAVQPLPQLQSLVLLAPTLSEIKPHALLVLKVSNA